MRISLFTFDILSTVWGFKNYTILWDGVDYLLMEFNLKCWAIISYPKMKVDTNCFTISYACLLCLAKVRRAGVTAWKVCAWAFLRFDHRYFSPFFSLFLFTLLLSRECLQHYGHICHTRGCVTIIRFRLDVRMYFFMFYLQICAYIWCSIHVYRCRIRTRYKTNT